jgi:hypothetical protein
MSLRSTRWGAAWVSTRCRSRSRARRHGIGPPAPARAAPGVPWLEPDDLTERETGIYPTGRSAANIMKAMSLVPDEVKSFFDVASNQYQGPLQMRDFSRDYRAISYA